MHHVGHLLVTVRMHRVAVAGPKVPWGRDLVHSRTAALPGLTYTHRGYTCGGMTTTTYTVSGMTCDHCVRAVTDEVSGVEGVDSVSVDLASGRVTVESQGDVDDAAVTAAVEEAGYEVTT